MLLPLVMRSSAVTATGIAAVAVAVLLLQLLLLLCCCYNFQIIAHDQIDADTCMQHMG